MAQNRMLADRLSNAVSAGIGKAQQAAQSAVGVIGEDEQARYALQIAKQNPQAFITLVQRLMQEDPETALAILRALLRNVSPEQANQVVAALSNALADGWRPDGAPGPMPKQAPAIGPGRPLTAGWERTPSIR